MPKLLADVRPAALRETRAQLLRDGAAALTMRSVASACGIAVGTLYNYFPSKDMLLAAAILEDWLAALHGMQAACEAAPDLSAGLQAVYTGVCGFAAQYAAAWAGYPMPGSAPPFLYDRHRQLVEQLAALLAPLAARCGGQSGGIWCSSAAELLLRQATTAGPEGFAPLQPVLLRLLTL